MTIGNHVEKQPLARPRTDETLEIDDEINPHYRTLMYEFRDTVLKKFKPDENISTLNYGEWVLLTEKLSNYESWLAEKSGALVESIDLCTVKSILRLQVSATAFSKTPDRKFSVTTFPITKIPYFKKHTFNIIEKPML